MWNKTGSACLRLRTERINFTLKIKVKYQTCFLFIYITLFKERKRTKVIGIKMEKDFKTNQVIGMSNR